MSKVTVEQFQKSPFSFVHGDEYISETSGITIVGVDVSVKWANESDIFSNLFYVHSLVPRPNTGTQPVGDDCVVEIEIGNGEKWDSKAGHFGWDISGNTELECANWKPSLKHLESQMDKPVINTNLTCEEFNKTESNIEVDNPLPITGIEWANGDVACYYNNQLREGGNLIYVSQHPTHSDRSVVFASEEVIPFFTVPTSMLSKPLTPEQLAEKERDNAINDIYEIIIDAEVGAMECAKAVYDAGYRK